MNQEICHGLNFIPYACIPLFVPSFFHSRTHFPAFTSAFFFLQRAYGVPFFFIPRFVRKRERDRKSAYYFSVDLCKRRTASVLLFILCNAKILCKNRRLYSFAEWNRNFNFEKNYCRFIVSMYLIDHSMKTILLNQSTRAETRCW